MLARKTAQMRFRCLQEQLYAAIRSRRFKISPARSIKRSNSCASRGIPFRNRNWFDICGCQLCLIWLGDFTKDISLLHSHDPCKATIGLPCPIVIDSCESLHYKSR